MAMRVLSEADIPSGSVGVFIMNQGQAGQIRGTTTARVGIIGAFQWGTENTWQEFANPLAFLAEHFPFGVISDEYEAISNVVFGATKWYNVAVSGSHIKSTLTRNDVGAAASIKFTAREYGSQGDEIGIDIIVNGSVATSRDIRVYVTATDGTLMHDETYLAVQVSNGTVTDPGDPYVLMETAASATDEAVAATGLSLATGTSGTLTAAAYLAGVTAGLGVEEAIDIFVVVGAADALIDDIRVGMETAADANPGKIMILPGHVAKAAATAITEIATYRGTYGNIRSTWPMLQRFVQYSYKGYNYAATALTVDGGALFAAMLQRTPPWKGCFMGSTACKALSGATVGIEEAYSGTIPSTYASLSAAGIIGWVRSRANGNKILPYNDVTTTITSVNTRLGDNVRYAQYLSDAIGDFLDVQIGELVLDIDLVNQRLGPSTSTTIGTIEGFMKKEQNANRLIAGLNDDGSASPPFTVDAFVNATAEDLADGTWGIYVAARKTPNARQIVLSVQFGTSVNITIVQV